MWLILTDSRDAASTWLADGLRARAPVPVHHLTSAELCRVVVAESETDDEGTHFRIELAHGFVIESRAISGVVNCVAALPPGLAQRCQHADREAVVRNYTSPVWRLLAGIPATILNRPSPQGLSGDYRLASDWVSLARDIGLEPVPCARPFTLGHPDEPLREEGVVRVGVVGHEVIAFPHGSVRLPEPVETKCRALADAARASLLTIDLARQPRGAWGFVAADPRPDLRPGGAPVLDAISRTLGARPAPCLPEVAAGSAQPRAEHSSWAMLRVRALPRLDFVRPIWRFLFP